MGCSGSTIATVGAPYSVTTGHGILQAIRTKNVESCNAVHEIMKDQAPKMFEQVADVSR